MAQWYYGSFLLKQVNTYNNGQWSQVITTLVE